MNRRRRSTRWALALALALAAVAAPVAGAQLGGAVDEVTEIVTSSDCTMSGGGRLTVAGGDEATFGGSASPQRRELGHHIHVNHGPATEFTFTSLEITSVTCIEDGRYATVTGTGRVESDGPDQIVGFRLEVQDNGDGRRPDIYHLTLTNGYDTGPQAVTRGEIQVHFR